METRFDPVDVTLRNGKTVRVRAIEPSDEEELLQAFERLGAHSRYMRFMHSVREANVPRLRTVLNAFPEKGLAIAATVPAEDGIDIVGAATFMVGTGDDCEFATTVAEDWTGAGLGRTLMTLLIEAAKRRGLREMVGFVLAENRPMLGLASRLGFRAARDPDDFSVCICRLPLRDAAGTK
jgi:GNAT superfamily N-acetyltransferase